LNGIARRRPAGAARFEAASADPDVDHVVADAEVFGEVVDAEFVGVDPGWGRDPVSPAQPADAAFVERAAARGEVTGVVEVFREFGVGMRGSKGAENLEGLFGAGVAGGGRAQDGELLACAGAPVDADAEFRLVGVEVNVTSAIRERSRRLWSRCVVPGAAQRRGRSRASASMSARAGAAGSAAC
jgi:hypothetical protein